MHDTVLTQTALRAAILADALVETVADLRLIEPSDIILYIRDQKWATLADLVQSSSELWLREGTLIFACMADCNVDWSTPPSISLELEFQDDGVSAFFTLLLGGPDCLIELKDVWFASAPTDEAAATNLLARAVAGARLPQPSPGRTL